MAKPSFKIGLMGAYSISDGYPNVKWLIDSLMASNKVDIIYGRTAPLKKKRVGLFNQGSKSIFSLFIVIATMMSKSITSLLPCLFLFYRKKIDLIYAPYPAHISLFFLSFLPNFIRPPVIVDGFISLYDSAVIDRKVLNVDSFFAKLLFWFEKRALESAVFIVVDTMCSANYLASLLEINRERFIPIPLMTDEENYLQSKLSNKDRINVLFIGTFVPLQGVETIAQAAVALSDNSKIYFTLVGYGQTASKVELILNKGQTNNVTWLKEWQSPKDLNTLINTSDICLGIFGKTEKASRVWPFKNYSSMRVGRPIISQETECLPNNSGLIAKPYISVPPDDVDALVKAIINLSSSKDKRNKYADYSRSFYEKNLSNDKALTKYFALFEKSK